MLEPAKPDSRVHFGCISTIDGIRYVDIGDHGFLRRQDLPIDVLPH